MVYTQMKNRVRAVASFETVLQLLADVNVGLALLTTDGTVDWHNPQARMVLPLAQPRANPSAVVAELAQEVTISGILRQAAAIIASTKRPVLIRWRHNGLPVRVVVRASDDPTRLLCIFHEHSDEVVTEYDSANYEIILARPDDSSKVAGLTPSELRILRLIAEGLSTNQIAMLLKRSNKTVEWHRAALGKKLGAKTKVELTRLAIGQGLVKVASTDTEK